MLGDLFVLNLLRIAKLTIILDRKPTIMSNWGYHLMLDCAGCSHKAITEYDTIWRFTKKLVEDIDMVAYGEPQIVKFGSGNKAGYTLVQLIETSNICAHFVDEDDTMYLDVFSCKPNDTDAVIKLVQDFFAPTHVRENFITRQA
jgi:S-adenosylmethionine decarboxylase